MNIGDKVKFKDNKIYTIIDIISGQDPSLFVLNDEQNVQILAGEGEIVKII